MSKHCVRRRSVAYKKSRLPVRDEWYNSNQTIHIDLIIIFFTISLRITYTSVEGRWGELGQLTHRPHGPTNPEPPSPFWRHLIDLLWFCIQQSRIWSMPKYYQSSLVYGTLTPPIIHEVMIDYLQEKKITLRIWKQTSVDKKRRSTWNGSILGGQVNNVLMHLQQ